MRSPEGPSPARSTRRWFIGSLARHTLYVTPAVLALTSRHADAGVSGCGQTGSPCLDEADCCTGWSCLDGLGMMIMMGEMGTCE